MEKEETSLKEQLIERGMPAIEVEKFLNYVNGERHKESDKDKKPVTNNTDKSLLSMALKFWRMGLTIDGVNVVIAGNNMAMVTYHGYKNTVLRVYPETEIDMQIVREGDTFNLAKESGSIVYSHTISDPFGNKPIVGAYAVIKNKRGEFVETLNRSDFEAMKDGSKQKYLWTSWESEFWLKSVLKRACKRHFNDIVEDIDKNDNEDFGLVGEQYEMNSDELAYNISEAKSRNELIGLLSGLDPAQKRAVTPLITKRIQELKNGNPA